MAFDPRNYPLNGNGTPESKIARLEAHHFHVWQRLVGIEEEIKELKRDRAALLRKIGGWGIWLLVVILSAVVSKGSTPGYLVQTFLGAIRSSLL